jgi:Tol biopolymer transport system component
MTLTMFIPLLVLFWTHTHAAQAQTITNKPASKITNGALPSVSPDGLRIAFVSNRTGMDDMFVVNTDGSGEVQLTHTPEHESFAGWAANSKRIAFSVLNDNACSLYIVEVDGANLREMAKLPGRNPLLSPDGKKILYSTGSWTEMRLMVAAVDGANARQINKGTAIAWNCSWSPDGNRIAFTSRTDPKSELAVFVMNADGSEKYQVSQIPLDEGGAQWPVWTADGSKLAVQVNSRVNKNTAHIWIIDVATGKARKLAAHAAAYLDETPSWFPDGKQLAFQSDRTGRMEVWVMNADGTGARQITH